MPDEPKFSPDIFEYPVNYMIGGKTTEDLDVNTMMLMSIAISLKRIADSMEKRQ